MRNISNPLMTFWKWTYRVIEIIQSLRNSPAICPISKNSKRQSYFGIKIQEHLNPDTISRLYKKVVTLSILRMKTLVWPTATRSPSTHHAPTLHLQNRYGPPQTTRSDICESLFELFPISSEKELLSTSIDYVILTLKPLPYRYFYIGCFPTYSSPKANNFALFTTSLLSC